MLLRTARIVTSIVCLSLFAGCHEGGEALTAERQLITAQSVDGLAPGAVLELDLEEAAHFSFEDGPIDFTRIVVVGADGERTLMQDLLAARGELWGVVPAELGLDDSFVLDAAMMESTRDSGTGSATMKLSGTLQWSQQEALQRLPRIDKMVAADDGVPTLVVGDLGLLPKGEGRQAAAEFLRTVGPVFRMTANSELEPVRSRNDELGQLHVRFQQYLHDLPVVGGQLTVHADGLSGRVHAVTGRFVGGEGLASEPTIEGEAALASTLAGLGADAEIVTVPDLVYVTTEHGARLAWSAEVEYTSEEGPERDVVFVDATSGELVTRHPQHHRALKRYVYNSGGKKQVLPGELLIKEGGKSGDLTAQDAYQFAGMTYDFYKEKFGRDSFNSSGAPLHSSVHFGHKYVNAYWDGTQMVYGDGDGVYAGDFARDRDVVVHELTHAVTQYEANLIYQGQSGALNEAFSDIMAAAVDAHVAGGVRAATWDLAETIWTPAKAGDAMRYMNNPTRDGQSTDYFPERYTGTHDNGGVHLNSGIANLAFYLTVAGGKHPRGKTSNVVPALGIDKATAIYYRALTNYLANDASFQDARNATAQAATELHGAEAAAAVHAAWTAVGVPGAPEDGGGGGEGAGGCAGTPFKGSLAAVGATQVQPSGNYYKTKAAAKHSGCLVSGKGTDFDLVLMKWSGSGWEQVAKSDGPSNLEKVTYAGKPGYYAWRVTSAGGTGAYTLSVQLQ
ncbi:MAG: M4 family metallopeptidase [Nannocystis sp.]|nr:M4 family metallopeptidase [Nannocystis sp.]MBA3546463.1 M4 family metallopeptidase [Nannocystis sp.]